MNRNRWWLLCLLAGLAPMPSSLEAQQSEVPNWFLRLRLPNAAAKSILTPAAWGAAYGVAFAGAGLTDRSPYLDSTDGVVSLGVGLGDPVLTLGLAVTTTMSDLSEANNFSLSFKLHRYLGAGPAIAVGGESLFSATKSPTTSGTRSSRCSATRSRASRRRGRAVRRSSSWLPGSR